MSKRRNRELRDKVGRAVEQVTLPTVDIITSVYGGEDFLAQLAATMLNIPAGVNWHWYIVDDHGPRTDKLTKLYAGLRTDSRCTVIMSEKNNGFAGANNLAFAKGKSPLVLMLNSDIRIIQPDWLLAMVNEFEDPSVGVVGARLIFFRDYDGDPKRPPGTVQHAGVAFNLLGQAYHIFLTWNPMHPKVNVRREMNAVTGACLMTRRHLYQKIGGFDVEYTTGNFEDVQYCLQARTFGYKVIYTPNAMLEHYSGGSNNTATAAFNGQLFQLKCRNMLEYDDWKYW